MSQTPDIIEIATQASKFIENNFKAVLGLFIVGIIGGSIWTFMKSAEAKKEETAFKDLYQITKIYEEKKEGFEKAKADAEAKKEAKDKKETAKKQDSPAPATGDMSKDYGEVVSGLENFLNTNSERNAAAEAALVLSEIYQEYNQVEKGVAAIDKVTKGWGNKNVLYYVMQMRSGDLWASKGLCENAVPPWTAVANSKSFIADQAQLKLGVCLQQIGRIDEAIGWFERLADEENKSTEAFNAKRYLRFLKFKKNNPNSLGNSKAEKAEKTQEKAS